MTQEIFDKAKDIDHDIKVLKSIKVEQDKNHWIGFITPYGQEDAFWDSTMQDDFKDFIDAELTKAQKMFEEL